MDKFQTLTSISIAMPSFKTILTLTSLIITFNWEATIWKIVGYPKAISELVMNLVCLVVKTWSNSIR